jgi:hypothetical protein
LLQLLSLPALQGLEVTYGSDTALVQPFSEGCGIIELDGQGRGKIRCVMEWRWRHCRALL